MNTRDESKSSILFEALDTVLGGNINKANRNKIIYHIRSRNSFWVIMPRTGKRVKASWLFNPLKINEFRFHENIVLVKNVLCYKVYDKNGVPELQIII